MKKSRDFRLKIADSFGIMDIETLGRIFFMYSLKDVALITGLTERTIRNYLSMGVLSGKKTDGVWHFTEEEIQAFLNHEYVKAALKSRRTATVFDFLKALNHEENSACVILHLPKENSRSVAKFFCDAVCKRQNVKMTFDQKKGANEVILSGDESVVFDIMDEYRSLRGV